MTSFEKILLPTDFGSRQLIRQKYLLVLSVMELDKSFGYCKAYSAFFQFSFAILNNFGLENTCFSRKLYTFKAKLCVGKLFIETWSLNRKQKGIKIFAFRL